MKQITIILIFLSPLTITARAADLPVLCDHEALTVDWPSHGTTELIGNQVLFTSYPNFSEASLEITNKGTTPIIQIAALIEIRDANEKHLLTFALHVTAPGYHDNAPVVPESLEIENGGVLDRVIFPADSATFVPTNPKILASCPKSAKLEFLQIDAVNEKQVHYAVSHWRSDPVLRPQAVSQIPPMPLKSFYEKLLVIRINKSGTPSLTYVEDYPDDLPKWLEALLHSWRFIPAYFDGIALQDELEVLFRFHPIRQADSASMVANYRGMRQPLVIVDIYPPAPDEHEPSIKFGRSIVNLK